MTPTVFYNVGSGHKWMQVDLWECCSIEMQFQVDFVSYTPDERQVVVARCQTTLACGASQRC